MNEWSDDQIQKALKAAFPPAAASESRRDLWPRMLRRMNAPAARVHWLDWAVAAVAVLLCLVLPGAASLLFYFL